MVGQAEPARTRYRLGIDIGGTFTDFALTDLERSEVLVGKCLTTPRDPSEGLLAGLRDLLGRAGLPVSALGHVVHATTLITNAIIERKGARTGLITTEGFRDLLAIGREVRYDLYDLFIELPQPLIPGALCREVAERIGPDGAVLTPLDADGVRRAVRELVAAGVEAVAIGFLHSYQHDAHERETARLVAEVAPELAVSRSSLVAREIREYERLSTTAANAYVQPLAGRYLRRIATGLAELGFGGALSIMTSNGGSVAATTAAELPIRLAELGPAAGALIAGFHGERAGEPHVLAFDMGGTTAKLCLVDAGRPTLTHALEVARVHRFKQGSGLPILAPSVELIEIGAGGGSIARLDELGLLAVGPASAASDPGPACYGFGGEAPTVTDADLALGYLNPAYFLGGAMPLDADAARRAIETHVAEPLALDLTAAAWGIYDVVNEQMATAAGLAIAEQGRDPRRYTLVATGGAGPVHAVALARKIGLRRVLVPPVAGVASATGLLVAPPRVDLAHSRLAPLAGLDWVAVADLYADLERTAAAQLGAAGLAAAEIRFERTADLRYLQQGHEVNVPVVAGQLDPAAAGPLAEAFTAAYRDLFGRAIAGVPIEVVTWRLSASGPAPAVALGGEADDQAATRRPASPIGSRPAYFPTPGGYTETPVYRRADLRPGASLRGPAIVEEAESTLVVWPGDRVAVDPHGNLIVTVAEGGAP